MGRVLGLPPRRVRVRVHAAVEGLRSLAGTPALLSLALSSFCSSAIQLSVIAFLVVLLVEEVGFDLVGAGIVLAAAQGAGPVGRVAWGLLADALRDGLAVPLGLVLLMGLTSGAVIGLSPAWPTPLVAAVFMVLGASAVGWNGGYLSEVARLSPAGAVGSVTSAAMFVTFTGVVVGPNPFHRVTRSSGQLRPWLRAARGSCRSGRGPPRSPRRLDR